MNVFESDLWMRPAKPSPQPSPGAKPGAATGYSEVRSFTVFESDFWDRPQTPTTSKTTTKPSQAPTAKSEKKQLALWDGGKFDFDDVLDVINPLHHIPVVSTIYRENVKDEIGTIPRILGAMLFGGGIVGAVVGAASAVVNIAIEQETGKDLGGHIYTAIFGDPKTAAPPPNTAINPTPVAVPVRTKRSETVIPPVAANTKKAVRVTGPPVAATTGSQSQAGLGTSSQFLRSEWYKKNQALLAAQAKQLSTKKTAVPAQASGALKTSKEPAPLHKSSEQNLLNLFAKPSIKSPSAPTGNDNPGAAAKKKTSAPQSKRSSPVASQMEQALRKYEALIKSRQQNPAAVDKKG